MFIKNLTVSAKLITLMVIFAIGLIGYGAWSLSTLNVAKVHGPYYNRIVRNKDLIADILPPPEYIIESYLMVLHMADEVNEQASRTTIEALVQRSRELKVEFDARHDFWTNELPDGAMKNEMIVTAYRPAVEFFRIRDEQFLPACIAGDAALANQLARGVLQEKYEEHRSAIDNVVKMATQRAIEEEQAVTASPPRPGWSMAWLISPDCGS